MCKPLLFSEQHFWDFVFDLNCTYVQSLPEAAAQYGKQMKSLSDYFRDDEELKLIEAIRKICKIVAPDRILAELDDVYFKTEGFGQLFQLLHLCLPLRLGSPQDKTVQDNTAQDKNRQDKTRQSKTGQGKKTRPDETRHDNTRRDETSQDETRQDKARHDKKDKNSQDKTRQDNTRRDKTRQKKAR
jgi:hypothetical protein